MNELKKPPTAGAQGAIAEYAPPPVPAAGIGPPGPAYVCALAWTAKTAIVSRLEPIERRWNGAKNAMWNSSLLGAGGSQGGGLANRGGSNSGLMLRAMAEATSRVARSARNSRARPPSTLGQGARTF